VRESENENAASRTLPKAKTIFAAEKNQGWFGHEASDIRGKISIAPGFSQGKKEAEKNAATKT